MGCEVCDALPHRRRLESGLPSSGTTLAGVENRDVFGALAISLAGSDEVQVGIAAEAEHQAPDKTQAARDKSCPIQPN